MAYSSATSGRVVSTVKLTAEEVVEFAAVSVATARTWYTPSVLSVPLGIVYEYVDPLVALVSADPVSANVESPAPVISNCTVATPSVSVTEAESVGAVEFVYALAVGAMMLTVGRDVSRVALVPAYTVDVPAVTCVWEALTVITPSTRVAVSIPETTNDVCVLFAATETLPVTKVLAESVKVTVTEPS